MTHAENSLTYCLLKALVKDPSKLDVFLDIVQPLSGDSEDYRQALKDIERLARTAGIHKRGNAFKAALLLEAAKENTVASQMMARSL